MLVELDPSSNKEGNTRAQSTDMHTLKPRHNLGVSFLKALTPLTFRLVTQKPFMLVELDPSSNKEGNTRAQSTDMHTLKPRHNLVVSFLKTLTPLTFRLVTQKPFMLVERDPLSNKEGNTRAQSTDMHTLKPRHNLVVSFLKTLTPLTFRLVTQKPFMLVELDPSSNKEGNTRAQSTDMHTLKPRHNLVVSFLKRLSPLTFRLVTQKPFMLVELDPSSNKEGNTRAQSTDMHTLRPRHNLVVRFCIPPIAEKASRPLDPLQESKFTRLLVSDHDVDVLASDNIDK